MVNTAPEKINSITDKENKFVLWFEEVGIEDVPMVGGKNASLGEMIQQLTKKGVNVPHWICYHSPCLSLLCEKCRN